MTTLRLSSVSVTYGSGKRLNPAVRDVSLEVSSGQTVALVGESGSGKSSLGRVMARLQKPTSGDVSWDISGSSRSETKPGAKPRVQMVFQHPDHSLNPTWTVRRSISEPLVRIGGMSRDEIRTRAVDALTAVGLPPEFLSRYPKALSGGQAQRVAVARAMIAKPQVVVLDEPTASLDQTVRTRLLATLVAEQRATGAGYLLVSHDMSTVRRMSDRIYVMYRGQIVEEGGASDVLDSPLHPYTRALIAAVPPPDPRVVWNPEEFSVEALVGTGSEGFGGKRCPIPGDCAEHPPGLVEVRAGHRVSCRQTLLGAAR